MNGDLAPHEIEKWDAEGTSYIWVKVSRLSGTTTQLTLFYGADSSALPVVTASDVWSQYAVVVHGGSSLTNAVENGLAVFAGSASVIGNTTNGVVGGCISKTTYSGQNRYEIALSCRQSYRLGQHGWLCADLRA